MRDTRGARSTRQTRFASRITAPPIEANAEPSHPSNKNVSVKMTTPTRLGSILNGFIHSVTHFRYLVLATVGLTWYNHDSFMVRVSRPRQEATLLLALSEDPAQDVGKLACCHIQGPATAYNPQPGTHSDHALYHYLNPSFTDDNRREMRDWVLGWE